RPSVVVGDSKTGETQKFDGPYFIIQWVLRNPKIAVLPTPMGAKRFRFNCVPRDFIVNAIDKLSTTGRGCYHLADPSPLTVDEIVDAIGQATGKRIMRIPQPMAIAKLGAPLLRIPRAAVPYFTHPTAYDTANARRDLGFDPPR